MSQFFDQASLVMIPSGYKTGKVYSQKPLSTDGELTFARASSATRVGPDGLIERVRTNLVLQSNTFSATWGANNVTLASGQSGYDGSNDAWLLTATGTTARLEQSVSANLNVFSIYAKAGTTDGIALRIIDFSTNPYIYWNLNDGSFVGTSGGGGINPSTQPVADMGGGWYRIQITTALANTVMIYVADSSGNLVTSGNILIQNSQLEAGDIATEPILTTTAAVSVGPVANLPRLDYLGSSCGKLLLEPQRQNVCLWSEQIDNAGWNKNNGPTITTNIATAPDGYGGADGIQSVTGGVFRTISQTFSVSANSTITASVFVKKETSETAFGGLGILFQGTSTKTCYTIFNAVTGTGLISGSSLTGTIKVDDYGNYWRLQVTTTDNGSNTSLSFSYYGTLSANGTTIGAGVGSVRTVWGFQLEIGASYATSYIGPTLGAAVTRLADQCYKQSISSLIGQTEGTLFLDFTINSPDDAAAKWVCFLKGAAGNYIGIYTNGGDKFIAEVAVATAQFLNQSVSVVLGKRYKMALAYKQNDFAFYVDGVQIATDSSGSVPACGEFSYLYNTSSNNIGTLEHNQTLLFKTRLTNAQLAELTTL